MKSVNLRNEPLRRFLSELLASLTKPTTYTIDDLRGLLNTIDADTGAISGTNENLRKFYFPYKATRIPTALGNYGIQYGSGTLSSATITFDCTAAPGSGKCLWFDSFSFFVENATTPLSALYRFLFQTKTTNTKVITVGDIPQSRLGERIPIGMPTVDANEELEVVVTEVTGAGNGLVTIVSQTGNFTP